MPDQLLPQPPPDAPAPPPSEEALQSRRKMGWIIWVGVGSILILLALPLFQRQRRTRCGRTEAANNAYQIGLALCEFAEIHGKYPELSTAAAVRKETGSVLSLSDSTSNDLFSQLLAAGFTGNELMFYARATSSMKPDNIFDSDATALTQGECCFAYIMGVDPKGNPGTPLAFGPVIPGTKNFDENANEGKVVVLRLDNSVTALPINSAGRIIYHGLDLLDPRQPYWHGKAPDVKWPK